MAATTIAAGGIGVLFAQDVPPGAGTSSQASTAASDIDLDQIEHRVGNVLSDAKALVAHARATLSTSPQLEATGIVEQSKAHMGEANIAGIQGIDPADLQALDRAAKGTASSDPASPKHPGVMVFVSLSMPKDSLRQTIIDAGKAGAVVVFRGFPGNSMAAFKTRLADVLGSDIHPHNVGIDPRLFEAFGITTVPTTVVTPKTFSLCSGLDCTSTVPDFDRLSGNVPLGYALETISHGSGPGANLARSALVQLDAQ